jgi:hypothetical protein
MGVTRQSLLEHFQLLGDQELLLQFQSGELTDLAKEVVESELRNRRIDCSKPETEAEAPADAAAAVGAGDMVLVARYSTAAEAYMLQSRLELEGLPAVVTDAQMAQNFLSLAVGGVGVIVPESHLPRAREIVLAVEKGDFALDGASEEQQS